MIDPTCVVRSEKSGTEAMQIDDLVSLLRGVDGAAFTPATIAALLANVSVTDATLQRFIFWRDRDYTRNLIYRDDIFELLAVCWDSGSASAIHDHAGQDCWLYVHTGALCIDAFELVDASRCRQVGDGICVRRRERIARLPQGVVDHRGPADDIHRVFNRVSFGHRAVSLHVYAKPYDECVIYEPARGTASRRALRYDSIAGRRV